MNALANQTAHFITWLESHSFTDGVLFFSPDLNHSYLMPVADILATAHDFLDPGFIELVQRADCLCVTFTPKGRAICAICSDNTVIEQDRVYPFRVGWNKDKKRDFLIALESGDPVRVWDCYNQKHIWQNEPATEKQLNYIDILKQNHAGLYAGVICQMKQDNPNFNPDALTKGQAGYIISQLAG